MNALPHNNNADNDKTAKVSNSKNNNNNNQKTNNKNNGNNNNLIAKNKVHFAAIEVAIKFYILQSRWWWRELWRQEHVLHCNHVKRRQQLITKRVYVCLCKSMYVCVYVFACVCEAIKNVIRAP